MGDIDVSKVVVVVEVRSPERQLLDANARAIRDAATLALAANKAFAAAAKPATAAAQASAAFDAAQRLARQQNGLIRLLLGQLDATD